jgi:hypothetical protein
MTKVDPNDGVLELWFMLRKEDAFSKISLRDAAFVFAALGGNPLAEDPRDRWEPASFLRFVDGLEAGATMRIRALMAAERVMLERR